MFAHLHFVFFKRRDKLTCLAVKKKLNSHFFAWKKTTTKRLLFNGDEDLCNTGYVTSVHVTSHAGTHEILRCGGTNANSVMKYTSEYIPTLKFTLIFCVNFIIFWRYALYQYALCARVFIYFPHKAACMLRMSRSEFCRRAKWGDDWTSLELLNAWVVHLIAAPFYYLEFQLLSYGWHTPCAGPWQSLRAPGVLQKWQHGFRYETRARFQVSSDRNGFSLLLSFFHTFAVFTFIDSQRE